MIVDPLGLAAARVVVVVAARRPKSDPISARALFFTHRRAVAPVAPVVVARLTAAARPIDAIVVIVVQLDAPRVVGTIRVTK